MALVSGYTSGFFYFFFPKIEIFLFVVLGFSNYNVHLYNTIFTPVINLQSFRHFPATKEVMWFLICPVYPHYHCLL